MSEERPPSAPLHTSHWSLPRIVLFFWTSCVRSLLFARYKHIFSVASRRRPLPGCLPIPSHISRTMSSISSFPSPSTLSPAIQQATSGSIGTLISTCALYPLSLVISRLQVQRELEQEAKSSAAHRQARLAREAAATAAARWAAREDAPADAPRHPKRYQHARAPSDYDGIADAFSKIYNTEGGLKALYTGLVSSERQP